MHIKDVSLVKSASDNAHCRIIGVVDNLKCTSLESQLSIIIGPCTVKEFNIIVIVLDIQFKLLKHRNLVEEPINAVSRN